MATETVEGVSFLVPPRADLPELKTAGPQPGQLLFNLKVKSLTCFVCLLGLGSAALPAMASVVGRVHAMTQATVKIEVTGGPIIYIDPFRLTTTPADADFILITHNHGDNFTAQVSGVGATTGEALVEIYELP